MRNSNYDIKIGGVPVGLGHIMMQNMFSRVLGLGLIFGVVVLPLYFVLGGDTIIENVFLSGARRSGFSMPEVLFNSALPYGVIAAISAWIHARRERNAFGQFAGSRLAYYVVGAALLLAIPFLASPGFTGLIAKLACVAAAWLLGSIKLPIVDELYEKKVVGLLDTKHVDAGDALVERVDQRFAAGTDDALLNGDLRTASEKAYPPAKWPELYTDIHEDIRRPIIVDGRLITGEFLVRLAPRRLSEAAVRILLNEHFRVKKIGFRLLVSLSIIAAVTLGVATYQRNGAQIDAMVATSASPGAAEAAIAGRDFWSPAERAAALESETSGAKTKNVALATSAKLLLVATSMLNAIAAGLLIFVLLGYLNIRSALSPRKIRGYVNTLINLDSELKTETKESIVRYKKRFDTRLLDRASYRQQIVAAKEDKSPLATIGTCTGTMAYRGSLHGGMPGQLFKLSLADFSVPSLIVGATGSGKTFSVLKPLLRQIMQMRPEFDLAILTMCAKGVFQHDTIRLAGECGLDMRVIGHKEGEYGVDLFGELDPITIGESLSTIMQQLSAGSNSDALWTDMASAIILHVCAIARAYEMTPEGTAEIMASGERLYSPVGVYRMAMSIRSSSGMLARAIESIMAAVESEDEDVRDAVASYADVGLVSAIQFVLEEVPTYGKDSLASFLIHVSHCLGGFGLHSGIRASFGACSTDKMLNIGQIWDNRTATTVNVNSFDGGGACARIIQLMIKNRVYLHARVRNSIDPDIAKKSKLFIMFDEAQELLSGGSVSSYAESNLLGFARSTGLSFVMAMPGISALYSCMGEGPNGQASQKILEQFRNQIILSSSGPETVAHVQRMAASALRSTVSDHNQYESFLARRFEHGNVSADDLVTPYDVTAEYAGKLRDLTNGDDGEISVPILDTFPVDYEHYNSSLKEGVDWHAIERSLVHRAEDKRDSFLAGNNSEEALVRAEDLSMLGRGQALVFLNRASYMRMDIVRLDPTLGLQTLAEAA